ncbi:MAG: helicase-exonuclease AddAB subunit AddA [Lachnospirales bacterium]
MNLTLPQQQAINLREKEILLSAAAGSGKTFVLINRIISLITGTKINPDGTRTYIGNSINLDKLLVATFTDASAKEMKIRLQRELHKELEHATGSYKENILNQLNLVPSSSIGTLHSFCSKVIRSNFHLLNLDPAFRVGDTNEIKLLQQESIEETFNYYYNLPNKNNDKIIFKDLLELFSNRVEDATFMSKIIELYDFTRSLPDPNKWLNQNSENFNNEFFTELILSSLEKNINYIKKNLTQAMDLCKKPMGPTEYMKALLSDETIILAMEKAIKNKDWDKCHSLLLVSSFTRIHSYRGAAKDEIDPDLMDSVKDIRDKKIKKVFNSWQKDYFIYDLENTKEDLNRLYKPIKIFSDLIKKFEEIFSQKKLEKNLLDYNDLEHFALKILKNEDIAKYYENKFYEILVDEYQDTNKIQEEILSCVAKKTKPYNKFMVGDVKQCIYKFRKSDPEIFMNKYNNFDNIKEVVINLSNNFRSKDIILNGTNFIFEQIMSAETGNIDYNSDVKLKAIAEEEIKETDAIEILLGKYKDEPPIEVECKIIGERIKKLINSNLSDGSPIKYGDITILLRSMTHINTFIDIFKKMNIPAFALNKISFFDTYEVGLMVSILQIIDNSMQDLHILTVLRSPLYGVTSEELLNISSIKQDFFYEKILMYIEENKNPTSKKIKKLLNNLNIWKKQAKNTKVSKLIGTIYEDTNIVSFMNVLDDREIRVGNLLLLKEKAVEYEKTYLAGLFSFLKYIERLKKSEISLNSFTGTSNDMVTITTVHRSKGLEYPIVFLSQIQKRFNFTDKNSSLTKHDKYGFFFKNFDPETRVVTNPLPKAFVANEIKKEMIAEEMRLLYVAMTRAKEKLIFTGTYNEEKEPWEKYTFGENEIDADYLENAKSYMDFLMPCILKHKTVDNFRANHAILSKGSQEIYNYNVNFTIQEYEDFDIEKTENTLNTIENIDLNNNINWSYGNQIDTTLNSVITISEIKRKHYENINNIFEKYREKTTLLPDIYYGNEKKAPKATEIGIAFHKVLENIKEDTHTSEVLIKKLIDELSNKLLLKKEYLEYINTKKILSYVNSPLGKRISQSTEVKKEVSFAMSMEYKDLYNIETNSNALLHGTIDCVFLEDDQYVVVDYKTDFYNNKKELIDKYSLQLELYKKALESSTNKKVKEVALYLFHKNEILILE